MEKISEIIMSIISNTGSVGPVLVCLLICIESIIPILPLAVFFTYLILKVGFPIGFILSYICTVSACCFSFFLFRKGVQGWFNRLTKDKKTLNNLIIKLNNISVSSLAVIIALPFTPAFLVNIAAGLSEIKFKKFFVSIIIGKICLIYFWGTIGTGLIESLKEPIILIKIAIMLILAFLISKLVNKKMKL